MKVTPKSLLVTDVDNTLFDWVDIWYRSFSAMLNEVVRITGLSAESLYPSISQVHQKHGTSEYAFLLQELPELLQLYGDRVEDHLASAIEAFRKARSAALTLYPSVLPALRQLSSAGVTIVAYTESMSFYTNYRFRKLGLDEVVDYLYSPPDHDLPDAPEAIRKYPPKHYDLRKTVHRHTPEGELKPNPHLLSTIIAEVGADAEAAVYVGDSLMKDVAMAQAAGVFDVHAAYGAAQHREEYALLRRVTHWRPEDVEREKTVIASKDIVPSMVLNANFAPIVKLFLEENDA